MLNTAQSDQYIFNPAREEDLPAVFKIIDDRIKWMDVVGIKQWNVTNYWECYPEQYYRDKMNNGELFVLREKATDRILGVIALLKSDYRWVNDKDALYAHHLATVLDMKGKNLAKTIIEFCKEISRSHKKEYLRLDCAVGNDKLNNFYESLGFVYVEPVVDGLYYGNKREFKL